jgi:hypothetical protein
MSSVVDSWGVVGGASLVVGASLVGWGVGVALVVVVVVVLVVVDMVDMVMTVVFVVRVGGGDVRRYTVGRGWFCREEADAESE